MARPRKEINQTQFESMCKILCTQEEICQVLDITDKPLNRWCKETYGCGFSEIYKKLSSTGKMSLRRFQFQLAEKNSAMAIFLGKNYLGQKDVVENTSTTEVNAQINNIASLLNNPKPNRSEDDV